jgi:hypothetical protein
VQFVEILLNQIIPFLPVYQFYDVITIQFIDYYEWWYTYLLPNVHYIPVKKDLSDLQEKIIWARNNDEKAHEIALNANAVVNQWMTPEHMYCYYAKAFELYRLIWFKTLSVILHQIEKYQFFFN